jgi:hypothetical protein
MGVGYGMANLMMSFLAGITGQARLRFVRKTRQVEAVQEQFLLTLLKAHQHTVLGREYGLAEIKTVEQFRQRVPILPYSSYEPYIERVVQGEANVLTPDPVDEWLDGQAKADSSHKAIAPFSGSSQSSQHWLYYGSLTPQEFADWQNAVDQFCAVVRTNPIGH